MYKKSDRISGRFFFIPILFQNNSLSELSFSLIFKRNRCTLQNESFFTNKRITAAVSKRKITVAHLARLERWLYLAF